MSQVSFEPASSSHQNNTARPHTQPRPSEYTTSSPPQSSRHSLPIDTKYPESALRTPLYALPFPHPKWGVNLWTGEVYEDTSLMMEALREDLGDVRESIEDVEEMSREKRKKKACEDEAEGEGTRKRREARYKGEE